MLRNFVFPEDKYLLIGTVAKPHGLRGEICISALSGQPELLEQYDRLTLVDKQGTLSPVCQVTSFRVQKNKAVIGLDRVTDRTFAEKLSGMGVLLHREDLPEPDSDEFYWQDLIGAPVTTVEGLQLGTLKNIFSNGAQDVMVIGDGSTEYLVPVTDDILVSQDPSEIVLDPPQGLLNINSDDDR